jgi:RimJ/RimL family protein N-acetyltransferase
MAVSEVENTTVLGAPANSAPANRPQLITLEGRDVIVGPLDPDVHSEQLYRRTHGPQAEQLWLYMSDGPFIDQTDFDVQLRRKAASKDPLYFAIIEKTSGVAVGYAAYLRIEPAHRSIEVGSILYSPAFQRTVGATEAMYLMARYVFGELGYRRYEWKCNALHGRSRRAALRLGFTFEGIFRQHMIVKGRNRDTAWFSMLDSEWPIRKARLEQWLAKSNFDADGRQKLSLSSLNTASALEHARS